MSVPDDLPLLLLLVGLLVFSVFIAAAETALLRIPVVRAASLAAHDDRRARRLADLLDDLPRVLNVILLTALLAQIGAATVTGILASRWFGSTGVTLASVALTLVMYVYAEAIPKTFAVRHADRVALALAAPVRLLDTVFRPIVSILVWIADLQMPGKGITMSPTVTEDELRRLASRAAREGQITEDDLALIERAFRFGDRQVDDVMVPRLDIIGVAATLPVEEALRIALESGHRRLPVYGESPDDITGFVRLRDLVALPAERRDLPVGRLAEPPMVVPESKRVLDLLSEMQGSGVHMAVVVDEYGGTAGLVTVEDIAEELLGSISEEPGGSMVVQLSEGRWSVDGGLPVEDLADLIGMEPPDGEWNTAAGLVIGLLGRLPKIGDSVDLDGLRIRVSHLRGRRITRLEMERVRSAERAT